MNCWCARESSAHLNTSAMGSYLFSIFSAYPNARCIVTDMSDKPKVTAKAEPNRKVNLTALQGKIAKKGKPSYRNEALAQDMLTLDPAVEGDAIQWVEATVNVTGDDPKAINAEKMKWRQRALSVASGANLNISITWGLEGEMYISLAKPKKG